MRVMRVMCVEMCDVQMLLFFAPLGRHWIPQNPGRTGPLSRDGRGSGLRAVGREVVGRGVETRKPVMLAPLRDELRSHEPTTKPMSQALFQNRQSCPCRADMRIGKKKREKKRMDSQKRIHKTILGQGEREDRRT